PTPGTEEGAGVSTRAPFGKVIDDCLQILEGAGRIGPEVGTVSFLAAGLQNLHRRFIHMHHRLVQDRLTQAIEQQLQAHPAHPFCEGGAWDLYAGARVDLFLTIERQVSGAGDSHPYALPEPDVSLSTHPAPIVHSLSLPRPNVKTTSARVSEGQTANSMLWRYGREASCICAAPIALNGSPVSLGSFAKSTDGRARNNAPSRQLDRKSTR